MDFPPAFDKRPKVSVVIPVFNRAGLIGRALDSVLAQTLADYEIIVVDDASTDGSAAFVEQRYVDKLKLIRNERNRGAGAARNLGVAAASGHYVAFLDSDDAWEPAKLDLQVATLDSASGGFFACSCDYFLWHGQQQSLVRNGLTPVKFRTDILFGCSISPGSTLMVRRDVFEKVGPFNESLRRLEDWDWLLRYVQHGDMLFVAKPLAHIHLDHVGPTQSEPDPVLQAIYRIRDEHLPRLQRAGGIARRQFESSVLIEIAARMYRQNRPLASVQYVLASLLIYPFRNQAFYRALWRALTRLAGGRP